MTRDESRRDEARAPDARERVSIDEDLFRRAFEEGDLDAKGRVLDVLVRNLDEVLRRAVERLSPGDIGDCAGAAYEQFLREVDRQIIKTRSGAPTRLVWQGSREFESYFLKVLLTKAMDCIDRERRKPGGMILPRGRAQRLIRMIFLDEPVALGDGSLERRELVDPKVKTPEDVVIEEEERRRLTQFIKDLSGVCPLTDAEKQTLRALSDAVRLHPDWADAASGDIYRIARAQLGLEPGEFSVRMSRLRNRVRTCLKRDEFAAPGKLHTRGRPRGSGGGARRKGT